MSACFLNARKSKFEHISFLAKSEVPCEDSVTSNQTSRTKFQQRLVSFSRTLTKVQSKTGYLFGAFICSNCLVFSKSSPCSYENSMRSENKVTFCWGNSVYTLDRINVWRQLSSSVTSHLLVLVRILWELFSQHLNQQYDVPKDSAENSARCSFLISDCAGSVMVSEPQKSWKFRAFEKFKIQKTFFEDLKF